MQYKIPQNVGIEDRIVGPLTLRQLIMLAVGFGISYVLFAILSKLYELNILEYIVIAIPAVLAAAFAMIRINDVTLTKFVFLFLEFAIKPKQRMWDHRGIAATVSPDLSGGATGGATQAAVATDAVADKAKQAANLKDLTRVLDSGGFEHLDQKEHEDIDDVHDDNLVTHSYFGHKENDTDNMYWRTTEVHKEMLTHIAKTSAVTTKPKPDAPAASAAPAKTPTVAQSAPAQKPAMPSAEQPEVKAVETPAVPEPPKRKRPRRRKKKVAQPVRENSNVDTSQKSQPAPAPKQSSGEFKFEELKKGEIEINLD